MERRVLRVLVFVFVFTAALLRVNAPPSAAQTVTGTILGTVRDQQGAVVPNASVTAKSVETGAERTVATTTAGEFSILSVPAGAYEVTASASGFQTEVRSGLNLTVGASLRVDFTLNLGAVTEKVEVTGEAPQVDTTSSTLSGLVGEATVRELPLNGRDWLQLATLEPGVQVAVTQNLPGNGEKSSPGTKMSISGGRPGHNLFRVDGLVINDHTNNSPGSAIGLNMGVDSIREFTVLTNAYSAEYGMSAGGVINALTKSGTNTIHGTAFYFLRNSALDARNFYDLKIPPFRRNQFGGSVGGPIKKDKLFFFTNYEGLRQFLSLSFASDTLSPDARNGLVCANSACTSKTQITIDPRIVPYLALYPAANGPITGDSGKYLFGAPTIGDENYVVGKIDYLINPSTTLTGSYSFDQGPTTTPDAFNNLLLSQYSRQQRVILSLQHVFSPTVLNTIRVGFNRDRAVASQDVCPCKPVATNLALGSVPGRPPSQLIVTPLSQAEGLGADGADSFWLTTPQFYDDLGWVKGRNNIRVGFNVDAYTENFSSGDFPNGRWTFGSVSAFLTGSSALQFGSDFPGSDNYKGEREKIFGAYFVDDFRVRPNLTLNLGLRYEPTGPFTEVHGHDARILTVDSPTITVGGPYFNNPTKRNFAPRVGLAWDPFGDGKTAVRAGFGVFDIVPLPNLFANRINRSAPYYLSGSISNPPASSFPAGAFSLFTPLQSRTAYIEPNPKAAYKMQWNFNIQRQITNDLGIMVGYAGSRGNHIAEDIQDGNDVPPPLVTIAPDGHRVFPKTGPIQVVNPNFAQVLWTSWRAVATYNALQVNLMERMRHGFSFNVGYVWSKSIDNGSHDNTSSEFNNAMEAVWSYDLNLSKGVSNWDTPHHLSANFVWDAPSPKSGMAISRFLFSGWELGGILTIQSGAPFSVAIPNDQARTGVILSNSHTRQRADFNAAPGCTPNATHSGNPNNYINLQCFSFPALGTLGNLGMNTLRAPHIADFDFSVLKNHNLLGERLKVQFRAELFNIFNRSNLGYNAVATAFNSAGLIQQSAAALVSPTITTSRQIQFALKLIW